MSNKEIKPTCSGKLLSSYFDLTVKLDFDIACECCSQSPVVSLRIMIFPNTRIYQLPSTFTNNWTPKMMPSCNFVLPNTFENFNMNAMSMQNNYPPPPPPPPLPPNNMNMMDNMAANAMNQQINMGNARMNMGGGIHGNINTGGMNANFNGGTNTNFNGGIRNPQFDIEMTQQPMGGGYERTGQPF